MKTGLAELANDALYNDYRRRLDARAVLDHYGAENCTEMSGGEGTTEIVHSCLIERVEPHHKNGDIHPSACLNVEKKLYVCYSGGWQGDLFHLIAKLEDKESLADALPTIGEFLTGATSDTEDFRAGLAALLAKPGVFQLDLPSYHQRILAPWAVVHPYLYEERGISIEAATKLQLGFDERENRIVFPHFWQDTLIGWQKRAIPPRPGWPGSVPDYPKYRNNAGFAKSETLYHYDEARQYSTVIVVESPMSVAKAVTLGFDNVCATFGAKVSDHQIGLLTSFERVIVWFDADTAGYAGERKLVEGLSRYVDVRVVIPERDRDLGDYHDADAVQAALTDVVPGPLRMAQYPQRRH